MFEIQYTHPTIHKRNKQYVQYVSIKLQTYCFDEFIQISSFSYIIQYLQLNKNDLNKFTGEKTPLGMLGENEKNMVNHKPEASD